MKLLLVPQALCECADACQSRNQRPVDDSQVHTDDLRGSGRNVQPDLTKGERLVIADDTKHSNLALILQQPFGTI